MAKIITGVLQSQTAFSILRKEGSVEIYPLGRHLRGSLGYLAMDLGLNIADKFPDLKWDDVIFRDMLPFSGCGELHKIREGGTFSPCAKCGDDYDNRVIRSVRTRNVNYEEVKEGRKYRIEIVVIDENYLNDVILIAKEVEKRGIRLGRMISSGHGLFVLRNWEVKEASRINGRKWILVSDAVYKGVKELVLGKKVKDSFERIRLKVLPRGTLIEEEISGFGIGEYCGLGFGEVVAV